MNTKCSLSKPARLLIALAAALGSHSSVLHAQGTAFTYQGQLTENGVPVNRTCDLIFRPFGVATGGTQVAFPALRTVAISNGVFTTSLDFGSTIFNGSPLWLQVEVSTNGFNGIVAVLSPRQQVLPAPYALTAATVVSNAVGTAQLADNSVSGAKIANGAVDTPELALGAVTSAKVADGTLQPVDLNLGSFATTFWRVGGNAGTSDDFIGTTDNSPFNIWVSNVRVMRFRLGTDAQGYATNAPNIIAGSSVNSALTTVVGATIAGGGGNVTNFLQGGFFENPNKATADFATVGGGEGNTASGEDATVAGGAGNLASGFAAVVGGGVDNTASGDYAMAPGGRAIPRVATRRLPAETQPKPSTPARSCGPMRARIVFPPPPPINSGFAAPAVPHS